MVVQYYRSTDYGMQDLPKAVGLARTACDAGEIAACDDFAEMHYRGEGMAVDLTRAAKFFKSSCDAGGRALSCFNYGLMNEEGRGSRTMTPWRSTITGSAVAAALTKPASTL